MQIKSIRWNITYLNNYLVWLNTKDIDMIFSYSANSEKFVYNSFLRHNCSVQEINWLCVYNCCANEIEKKETKQSEVDTARRDTSHILHHTTAWSCCRLLKCVCVCVLMADKHNTCTFANQTLQRNDECVKTDFILKCLFVLLSFGPYWSESVPIDVVYNLWRRQVDCRILVICNFMFVSAYHESLLTEFNRCNVDSNNLLVKTIGYLKLYFYRADTDRGEPVVWSVDQRLNNVCFRPLKLHGKGI